MPAWSRILRALFVVYVVLTAVHIGWVVHHEPFSYDAWNMAVDTHAEPITLHRFLEYWKFELAHSNPRLGQPLAYLAYKLEYVAVILTPLAYLLLAGAAVVLGTARRPSWARGRDLTLYAIALGCMWFALPQLGKIMFCRAYGANYVYGAAVQLWFLVPLRLVPTARVSLLKAVLYLLAGIVAGACNEHTGPTLCLFMLGYAWWKQRASAGTRTTPTLAWAGALGSILGFCLIFFAPGQSQRYDGLAQKVTLLGRLLSRGVSGNLTIYRELILAAAPLFGLIALVAAIGLVREVGYNEQRERRRQALRLIVLAIFAGSLITATLFVSPKLGPRFYLVSMMLLLVGFIALVDVVLTEAGEIAPFAILAVVASIYAAVHTVPLYGRLARESAARLAVLEHAQRGDVVTLEAFDQLEDDWWFLGDDARAPNKRELIKTYFALGAVLLRADDPAAPLGVSDVRLVPSERGLELDTYRGLDLASIHAAFQQAISIHHPDRLDHPVELAVEFVGARPALPRPALLVARSTPQGFEGWTAKLERKGRATTRTVTPVGLPADLELWIYLVGGEARPLGKQLTYTPWHTGTYWVLACRPTECFVIAAAKQGGP